MQRRERGNQKEGRVSRPESRGFARPVLHNNCAGNDVISTLYVTDIGYYPKAKFHYRERPHGADQHILIYCHDGSGKVKIDKTEYRIEPGDFLSSR